MRRFAGRLKRLEKSPRLLGALVCAECGMPKHRGATASVVHTVEFEGEESEGPDRCGACGRQLRFRVTFDSFG